MIAGNVTRNASIIRNNIQVAELDFKAQQFSDAIKLIISDIDIVICADGKLFSFPWFRKVKIDKNRHYFSHIR